MGATIIKMKRHFERLERNGKKKEEADQNVPSTFLLNLQVRAYFKYEIDRTQAVKRPGYF